MPTPILMPALSPTMEQGKLAEMAQEEGDKVSSGDAIAEIETDKATMEVEAVDEGTIGKIMIAEGTEGVAVNTPIAILLGEGEDASAIAAEKAADKKAPSPLPLSRPESAHGFGHSELQARQGELAGKGENSVLLGTASQQARPTPSPLAGEGRGEGEIAAVRPNGHGRIFASPLARRIAAQAASIYRSSRVRGREGGSSNTTSMRPCAKASTKRRAQPRRRKTAAKPWFRPALSQRRCPTIRSSRFTRRAPTRSARSTICARPSLCA